MKKTNRFGKIKSFLAFALVFIIGIVIGASSAKTPQEVVKEVPKEVIREVVKEVPATCDYSDWKKLKDLDDQGISYCSVGFNLAAQGFNDIANGEFEAASALVPKIQANTQRIQDLATQRAIVLQKLGY